MITEGPVIDLLEVEVRGAIDGFVLGRDQLDVGVLGDASTPVPWIAYTCDSLQVVGQRGGKRAGVVNTMSVGQFTITLLNAADPTTEPHIVPNVPVRIRAKNSSARPIFTGMISDIDMTYAMDKATGKISTLVSLVVVDGVQAHANTTRYGAIAPDGFERWESRIQRLADSSTAPINPPPVVDPIVRYAL